MMNLDDTRTGRLLKASGAGVVEHKGKLSLATIATTAMTLMYLGINPVDLAVHHTDSFQTMNDQIKELRLKTQEMEYISKVNDHLESVVHIMAQKMFLAEMITIEELTDILVDPNE